MGSRRFDLARVHDDDAVGHGHRGQPVRDDQDRGHERGLGDRLAQGGLVERVELGGGFVKQQQAWPAQQCAADGHALALASRQPGAAVAHRRLNALRQARHKGAETGDPQHFGDLRLGRARRAEKKVLPQGP